MDETERDFDPRIHIDQLLSLREGLIWEKR